MIYHKISNLEWKGTLGRICDRCEKRFIPNGKSSRICEPCKIKAHKLRFKK